MMLGLGDPSVAGTVLSTFLSEHERQMEELSAAIEADDSQAGAQIAHALKGASRSLGLAALGDEIARFEASAPRGRQGLGRRLRASAKGWHGGPQRDRMAHAPHRRGGPK